MPMNKKDRKSLSPPRGKLGKQPLMPQLLQVCRGFFQALEERYPKAEQSQYSLRDCQALFMATFLFKFPSLSSLLAALKKDFRPQESLPCDGIARRVRANLRGLFGLQRAPCDTTAQRRWLIENCIFETLKALNGMNLEHNFGHGQHNLCNNLTVFMLTAALMDQISLIWCADFQAVR